MFAARVSTSSAVATAYGVSESDTGTIAPTIRIAAANLKLYLCPGKVNQLHKRSTRNTAVQSTIAPRNVSLLVSRPTTSDGKQLSDAARRPNPLAERAR